MSLLVTVPAMDELRIPPNILDAKSNRELKELNEDEGKFAEFFSTLELMDVIEVQKKHDQLVDRNRELAVANLELEPRFTECKETLTDLHTKAAEIQREYKTKFEELKSFSSRTQPATVFKDLQQAVKTSEGASDDIAEDFLAGKSSYSLDEFVDAFMKERTQFWMRKVKAEKMEELLKSYQPPQPKPRRAAKQSPPQPPQPYQVKQSPPQQQPPNQSLGPYPPSGSSHPMPTPYQSLPPGAPGGMPHPPYPPTQTGYGGPQPRRQPPMAYPYAYNRPQQPPPRPGAYPQPYSYQPRPPR